MQDHQLPQPNPDWAIFLDFDGTIVELASHPDEVTLAPQVPEVLRRLEAVLGGAVAIVTGRTIASLDRLLGDTGLSVAGVHGVERRRADGHIMRSVDSDTRFDATRSRVAAFVAEHPGTHYEDKGCAVTLHTRQAPECAPAAEALLEAEREHLGDGYQIQRGHDVIELKPSGQDKGTVVASFLAEPPFRGRTPVFIGDDVTDEDAFAMVRRYQGHAIRVGDRSESYATATLATVREVLAWLAQIAQTLEARSSASNTTSSWD